MAHDNHYKLGRMVGHELAELFQRFRKLGLGLKNAVVDDQFVFIDAGSEVEGPHATV